MLTKTDLALIEALLDRKLDEKLDEKLNVKFAQNNKILEEKIDKKIKENFEDFYDNIFEPFATRTLREFNKIHSSNKITKATLSNHEERISEIEELTAVKN